MERPEPHDPGPSNQYTYGLLRKLYGRSHVLPPFAVERP